MGHAAAILGEHRGISVERPLDQGGCGAAVAVPVGVVRPGDARHRADEVQLAGVVPPVKLGDDGMVLVEVGLRSPHGRVIRGHHRAVQPLVGVQHHRQHPGGVVPVEHRLVQLRLPLAGKDLSHVSHPGQVLPSRRPRIHGLEGTAVRGRVTGRRSGQIHRGLESRHPFHPLGGGAVPARRQPGHHHQVVQRRVAGTFRRRSGHLQDAADGAAGAPRGMFVQDRDRHARQHVRRTLAGGQGRAQDAGEVGAVACRLGPGLDDVEDRPRPAVLAGSSPIEGDVFEGLVLEQQCAQLTRIDVEGGPVEPGGRAETKGSHRVVRQCQIHAVASMCRSRHMIPHSRDDGKAPAPTSSSRLDPGSRRIRRRERPRDPTSC